MNPSHIFQLSGSRVGMSSEKCFAHVDGDIRRYCLNLKERLRNFDIYAKRFETILNEPIIVNNRFLMKSWII